MLVRVGGCSCHFCDATERVFTLPITIIER
jgi:hypothetical protein